MNTFGLNIRKDWEAYYKKSQLPRLMLDRPCGSRPIDGTSGRGSNPENTNCRPRTKRYYHDFNDAEISELGRILTRIGIVVLCGRDETGPFIELCGLVPFGRKESRPGGNETVGGADRR